MKTIVKYFIFLGFCSNLYSQGNIIGNITDIDKTPFEFATIVVYQSDNLVTGVITNKNGEYILSKLPYGTYKLEASFLGYKTVILNNIILNSKVKAIPTIILVEDVAQLDEVVITQRKEFIKKRFDKKIIQVSQNLNTSGGSLGNVLLSDPSFNTDASGAISFRGSQNFKVLIDGRPSLLNGSDALLNIPISSILRVEVVTNPSAKFQADSEVGIINIILKKQYSDGLSGQVGLRYDYRDKGNTVLKTDVNLQAKWNKTRLYFQASWSKDTIQLKGPTTVNIENPSKNYSFHRNRVMNQLLLAKNLNIQSGVDIETSQKNTIGFWAKLYHGNSDYNSISNDIDMQNNEPVVLGRLDYKNDRKASATQLTLEDTYKINDEGELHILTDFSFTNTKRNNFRDYFIANQINPNNETHQEQSIFYQDENRNRWHSELNYINAINDSTKLEIGLLHEYYKRTNTFKEFNFDVLVFNKKADFEFNIYNAYINYSSVWKGIQFSLGSRFEHSTRKLEGLKNNSLTAIFPSITLGKKFEKGYLLIFNYAKRIRRPSARDLSPILLYSDNQVTWRGNPGLTDAKVHNLSFGIQKEFEEITLNAELFYRLVDSGWFRVLESVGNNRFENYPITINDEENSGLELSSNWNISQKLNLSLNGSLFKQKIDNKEPRKDIETTSSRFVFTSNYNPIDYLKLQFDINYNGPMLYANSKIAETHYLNFSVQKKFPKAGLTLTLFANDFTGGNIYKQTYINSGINDTKNTQLQESYPSSTKYFGFHLKYGFRNYKKKNVNPNIQFNDQ